jgi:hypothetical protein
MLSERSIHKLKSRYGELFATALAYQEEGLMLEAALYHELVEVILAHTQEFGLYDEFVMFGEVVKSEFDKGTAARNRAAAGVVD